MSNESIMFKALRMVAALATMAFVASAAVCAVAILR